MRFQGHYIMLPYVTPAICYYTKVLRSKHDPNSSNTPTTAHPLSTPNWIVQRRRTGSTWNASASGFSHFSSVKSIGRVGHFQSSRVQHSLALGWYYKSFSTVPPNHTPNLRQVVTRQDFSQGTLQKHQQPSTPSQHSQTNDIQSE